MSKFVTTQSKIFQLFNVVNVGKYLIWMAEKNKVHFKLVATKAISSTFYCWKHKKSIYQYGINFEPSVTKAISTTFVFGVKPISRFFEI
jgi:hypothetical protein